jgi:hypothetical protein
MPRCVSPRIGTGIMIVMREDTHHGIRDYNLTLSNNKKQNLMLNEVKSRNTGRKIISFMHISLDGFVTGPSR